MADGVDHIDIYADVGEEFNQEAEYGGHDQIDLYDDVISPSANNGDAPEDRDYMDTLPPTVGDDVGKGAAPNVVYTYTGKRIALYIGNLTWWTTDEDLTEAVHSLGVNDILEIKFFENRANGQSKGTFHHSKKEPCTWLAVTPISSLPICWQLLTCSGYACSGHFI
ncbi:cleavage and polyadenylation specific factor 6 [Homo sapiens]|uniref:Cleavage and polyadenylation specific factor 6 n=1 Tax=Homo sapiens TaxID=9606 RepID=A0A3B3ISW1_HUMAN|nr:cleavage and polyadenylation specific factor 6 [Homo sapiens]KAI4067198.1 cleavage and polyadenylation specific factor 6 [Homo sapiens]